MRFSSGCLVGILLGIALAVLAYAGYAFLNSTEQLPLTPASSVNEPDVTVTIKEQYVNDQVRKAFVAHGMEPGDLTIELHAPNRAEATMSLDLTILGQSLNVRPHTSFHFGVTNGLVTLDVDSVDVSGFRVPQDIVNQQTANFKRFGEDQLNGELKRVLANTGLHVVGIESTEGALVVQLSH